MSWTHQEWKRFPCRCGSGQIVITMHESDNSYSGDYYSGDFTCEPCRTAFMIETEGRGRSFKVRCKSDRSVVFEHVEPPIKVSELFTR